MTTDIDREALGALLNAKWEYMEQNCRADAAYGALPELDEMGEQGWELVSAVRSGAYWCCIFKRRKTT